ncbi:hypothetical protein [Burkholderia cenocepacia]|uniref:hypothetical protein n=1 Tax=Burkholderia cenocepacia TaxID=95486 RepID=UPI0009821392|nr:hypothetical protein [Burkholderia cenocepacia]AQQ43278.1 hypothetical protein A8E75_30700 [Burkholderia cenocepacia]ONV25304.1 hypothetical protein A8E74_09780 [Burkholderia cenocepacia]ONV30572.1 hypothetical protein A8E78_17345 [Burkholderia cenocepacia]ONV33467.1 hypothetical protein A8E77_15945 [Burkholderia cenocepacia]ONV40574.1 hypothetical protein A8E82_19650 [Burkholderia cenocepacia]
MLFEVITEKTYTRTETSIQLVEAESKEEAIQKAAELPHMDVSCEADTKELTYAVEDLPGAAENIKKCRRLLARMGAKSKDEDEEDDPAIYDDKYFQFLDHLNKHG